MLGHVIDETIGHIGDNIPQNTFFKATNGMGPRAEVINPCKE